MGKPLLIFFVTATLICMSHPHHSRSQRIYRYLKRSNDEPSRFIDECGGMAYEERLRIVGLTMLETRRLRADMVQL